MKLARKNHISILGQQNCSRFSVGKKVEKQNKASNSTVDYREIEHLSKISDTWWDFYNGQMKTLHSFNPLRIEFIRNGLRSTGLNEVNPCRPLQGVKLLDVGCGAGILTESLAKMGAEITGIDASKKLLTVAKEHAALDDNLASSIVYENTTIEDFSLKNKEQYDAVVASEILEHVLNPQLFLKSCTDVLKPNGSIFITTQNRNLLSWFGIIFVAEHILEIVPKGTHDWNKFLTPDETKQLLDKYNCQTKVVQGSLYNVATNHWSWFCSTAICYALHAVKERN